MVLRWHQHIYCTRANNERQIKNRYGEKSVKIGREHQRRQNVTNWVSKKKINNEKNKTNGQQTKKLYYERNGTATVEVTRRIEESQSMIVEATNSD